MAEWQHRHRLRFNRIEQDVTWMETSTQQALGIQPAQRLGAVSTGILPSQDTEKPSATELHG
jgi:hypothetical protein